ncbi:MAG: glycosyltransferase family 4 protein [Chlamydiales bacterium]
MKSVVILKSRLEARGGLEKYTRYLAAAFAERGYTVKILTTGNYLSWGKIEVISLGKTSKFSLYHLWKFNVRCQKWLQKYPADIVFGMERNTFQTHYRAGSGVHAIYLKRRMMIDSWFKSFSCFFNPLHRYLLKVEKMIFNDPKLKILFTNSNMVKKEILATYKIQSKKIQVIHNGVEWVEKERPFQETFLKPRRKVFHFLFVGNGFKRKGLAFLLRGLKTIKDSFFLTVVGKDKNLSFYQKLAKNLCVRFVGEQKDVTPFYQEADALVIPSIYDPFSNVTLEGLAMGLFVVSSKYNGGHEILTRETGVVIENLMNPKAALERAFLFPKTLERATLIRQSIKDLDFSNQLDKLVSLSLC